MNVPKEVVVALLAGLFGLVPVMVQVITARAQRRDANTRLNNLRTELEFLERLSALQEKLGAAGDDDTPQPLMQSRIRAAVSSLLERYDALPESVPSLAGAKPFPRRFPKRLPLLRRAFLLYKPETPLGWLLHTLFYTLTIVLITLLIGIFSTPPPEPDPENFRASVSVFLIGFLGIPILVIRRAARYTERRQEAPKSEAPAPH
jgi:hypothetical protein